MYYQVSSFTIAIAVQLCMNMVIMCLMPFWAEACGQANFALDLYMLCCDGL
jgi:hypothetical protein